MNRGAAVNGARAVRAQAVCTPRRWTGGGRPITGEWGPSPTPYSQATCIWLRPIEWWCRRPCAVLLSRAIRAYIVFSWVLLYENSYKTAYFFRFNISATACSSALGSRLVDRAKIGAANAVCGNQWRAPCAAVAAIQGKLVFLRRFQI